MRAFFFFIILFCKHLTYEAEFLNITSDPSMVYNNMSLLLFLPNSSIILTSENAMMLIDSMTVSTNRIGLNEKKEPSTLTKDMERQIAFYNNLGFRIWEIVSPTLLGKSVWGRFKCGDIN